MSQEKHEPVYASSSLKLWVQRVMFEIDEAQKMTGVEVLEHEARAYLDWIRMFLQALDGSVFPVLYRREDAPSMIETGLMVVALAKFVNVKSLILEPLDSSDSPFPAKHPMLVDFIRRLLVLDKEIPEGLDALALVFCEKTSAPDSDRRSELPQIEGLLEKLFHLPNLREHLLVQYEAGVMECSMLREAAALQLRMTEHLQSNAEKLKRLHEQLDDLAATTNPHDALNDIRAIEAHFEKLLGDFSRQEKNFSSKAPSLEAEVPIPSSSASSTSSQAVPVPATLPAHYVNFNTAGRMAVLPVTSMLHENAHESLKRLQELRNRFISMASPIYDSLLDTWIDAPMHPSSSKDSEVPLEEAQADCARRLQSLREVIEHINHFPTEHQSRNLKKAQEEERLLVQKKRALDNELRAREQAAFQNALTDLKPEAIKGALREVRKHRRSLQASQTALEADIQRIDDELREVTRRLLAIKPPVELPKRFRGNIKRALEALQLTSDAFSINHSLTPAGFAELRARMDAQIETHDASIKALSMQLLGTEGGIQRYHLDEIICKISLFDRVLAELQNKTHVPYDEIATRFADYAGNTFDKESGDDGYAKFLELLEPLQFSTKDELTRPGGWTTLLHGTNFSKKAIEPLKREVERVRGMVTQKKDALEAALSQQQAHQESIALLQDYLRSLNKIKWVPAELQAQAERKHLQRSQNLLQESLNDAQNSLCASREEANTLGEKQNLLETFLAFHRQLHSVMTDNALQDFEGHAAQAQKHGLGVLHHTLQELGRRKQQASLPESTEHPIDVFPSDESQGASTTEPGSPHYPPGEDALPVVEDFASSDETLPQAPPEKSFSEISPDVSRYIDSIKIENKRFAVQLAILKEQITRLHLHAIEINRDANENGREALAFARKLMAEVAKLAERSGEKSPTPTTFEQFRTDFNNHLANPPESIGRHRELWKPILLNIALCIPLLFRLLAAPCTPGGFRFFGQNTKREDIVDDIKDATRGMQLTN